MHCFFAKQYDDTDIETDKTIICVSLDDSDEDMERFPEFNEGHLITKFSLSEMVDCAIDNVINRQTGVICGQDDIVRMVELRDSLLELSRRVNRFLPKEFKNKK